MRRKKPACAKTEIPEKLKREEIPKIPKRSRWDESSAVPHVTSNIPQMKEKRKWKGVFFSGFPRKKEKSSVRAEKHKTNPHSPSIPPVLSETACTSGSKNRSFGFFKACLGVTGWGKPSSIIVMTEAETLATNRITPTVRSPSIRSPTAQIKNAGPPLMLQQSRRSAVLGSISPFSTREAVSRAPTGYPEISERRNTPPQH
ncbi:MAG: hypothetical protein IJY82_03645 [Oscillospiraceae bacterium]|nr:hypothetical protein [Oscillospiraceae bacterium]